MAGRSNLSSKDVPALKDLLQGLHVDALDEELSSTVVELLAAVVHSDDVSRVALDPREQHLTDQVLLGAETGDADADEIEALFWPAFWSTPVCSYPHLHVGPSLEVHTADDFMSDRQLRASLTGELFRLQGVRHNVVVPLRMKDGVEERLELFRYGGRPFSERDKLVLTLLGPHFAARMERVEAAVHGPQVSQPIPPLTPRQREVLALAARGMTNRQIAAQLVIAQGTVQRHLENIFAVLEVHNRAGAVGISAGSGTRPPRPGRRR